MLIDHPACEKLAERNRREQFHLMRISRLFLIPTHIVKKESNPVQIVWVK